jgi:hypothetical protein
MTHGTNFFIMPLFNNELGILMIWHEEVIWNECSFNLKLRILLENMENSMNG